MGWNGTDLVNDFAAELGDTTSAFKSKVLRWIYEGTRNIATAHRWAFLRERGEAILKANQSIHDIFLTPPTAPTIALTAGGSLTAGAEYKVLVTFYEAKADVESKAGTASSGVIPSGIDLSFDISTIPVSPSSLVTERRIYVSKAGAAFAYHSSILNNTGTTASVSSDTTSVVTPPDENYIQVIDGDFFLDGMYAIQNTSLQDLNAISTPNSSAKGKPILWADINQEQIQVYPKPSTDTTVNFFYYKLPARVFGTSTSVPQIPSWLYDDLRNYVIWRGFNYRDRAGQESKKANYDQGLRQTISTRGKPIKRSGRVRCVTVDSDGFGG